MKVHGILWSLTPKLLDSTGMPEIYNTSESQLVLLCGEHTLNIPIPFPMQTYQVKCCYENVISVQATHRFEHFLNRRPMFMSVPDNFMCFPVVHLEKRVYEAIYK